MIQIINYLDTYNLPGNSFNYKVYLLQSQYDYYEDNDKILFIKYMLNTFINNFDKISDGEINTLLSLSKSFYAADIPNLRESLQKLKNDRPVGPKDVGVEGNVIYIDALGFGFPINQTTGLSGTSGVGVSHRYFGDVRHYPNYQAQAINRNYRNIRRF